jgi:hypothetical protein
MRGVGSRRLFNLAHRPWPFQCATRVPQPSASDGPGIVALIGEDMRPWHALAQAMTLPKTNSSIYITASAWYLLAIVKPTRAMDHVNGERASQVAGACSSRPSAPIIDTPRQTLRTARPHPDLLPAQHEEAFTGGCIHALVARTRAAQMAPACGRDGLVQDDEEAATTAGVSVCELAYSPMF